MNYFRTAILLAGLTALFMGVGYLIGGQAGAMIALLVAAGMNLFAYWNADKLVLRCTAPRRSMRAPRPISCAWCGELARRAGLPMPRVYLMDNPQPNAFATGRNPENAAVAVTTGLLQSLEPRGDRRRHRARARPHQEPRHADHDHHRDHRRRDLDARALRLLLRRQPRQQQRRSASSARSRW